MSFTPKPTTSTEYFSFDFSAMLGVGETIASASYTLTLSAGTGTSGSPLAVSGSVTINGAIVSQLLTGGQGNAIYLVTCNVVTSLGQTLSLWSDLQVVAPS